jgi:2-polyprenyl-3-methyl-5-hydroxy-6-metoxy-1,4-benzoquinol methylase
MKRVVGRPIIHNQYEMYSKQDVKPIDKEVLDYIVDPTKGGELKVQKRRMSWLYNTVQSLANNGNICYDYLDIGTYDGMAAFLMGGNLYTSIDRTVVDAIEPNKQAFDAAAYAANYLNEKGFKIKIHNTDFVNYNTDKQYDIISAFEVIEHMEDPLSAVEKMYNLLRIGGNIMLTLPEIDGIFGIRDNNPYHYWTSTVQSVISVLFADESKWKIKEMFEHEDLIHMRVQKRSFMR